MDTGELDPGPIRLETVRDTVNGVHVEVSAIGGGMVRLQVFDTDSGLALPTLKHYTGLCAFYDAMDEAKRICEGRP